MLDNISQLHLTDWSRYWGAICYSSIHNTGISI